MHPLILPALLLAAVAPDLPQRPDVRDIDRLVAGLEQAPFVLLGAGPEDGRAALRFTPRRQHERTVVITTAHEMVDYEGGVGELEKANVPAYTQTARLTQTVDDHEHTFTTTVRIEDTAVVHSDDLDPRMIAAVNAGVTRLVGNTYAYTLTHAGEIIDHTQRTKAGADIDATPTGDIDWIGAGLILPERPIAPGARWRTLSLPDQLPGMTEHVVRDYTLTAVTDDTITVDVRYTKVARLEDEKNLESPLRDLLAVTVGTLTYDRALGRPVAGELATASWATMQMVTVGRAQVLQQAGATTVTIEPAPAPEAAPTPE